LHIAAVFALRVNEASDKRNRSPHALVKRKNFKKSIENSNVIVTFLVIAG